MTVPLRPEVAFVLAALRRDALAPRALQQAAARVDDWGAVARFTAEHDVAWWVWQAETRVGAPDDARAALERDVRAVAVQALAGARQLAELSGALGGAGVRAVAFKGPALSSDVHGDIGARHFLDLDILVSEADRDRARAVLLAAGYAAPEGYSEREERFYSRWEGVGQFARSGDLPVELHWRCQPPRYGGPQDPADVVARARPCALGGGTVLVPAPEDLGLLLALHGVKHAWGWLLWVADFAAAANRAGFDWELFARRATSWRVRLPAHYAVLVAHELVALEVPVALLRTAREDARALFLSRAVVARLTRSAGAADIGEVSSARYDLQWLEGVRAKLRYVVLAAALPTPQERRVARLPDALLPLAYAVRAWRLLLHAWGRRA